MASWTTHAVSSKLWSATGLTCFYRRFYWFRTFSCRRSVLFKTSLIWHSWLLRFFLKAQTAFYSKLDLAQLAFNYKLGLVFCARAPGGKIDRPWGLLSINRSEKTPLVITTLRSSTGSFANDLAPRLSNRRMHQLGSGPCRARVISRVKLTCLTTLDLIWHSWLSSFFFAQGTNSILTS